MGSQGSSQVVAWDTGFHSSPGGDLGVPLELGGVFSLEGFPWEILTDAAAGNKNGTYTERRWYGTSPQDPQGEKKKKAVKSGRWQITKQGRVMK